MANIKTTFWTLGLLGILIGFALAASDDYKSLRASEASEKIPALPSTAVQKTVSEFEIKDWPRNLRTDLKGSSIKVVLPENAPDGPRNDALMRKFRELTGIEVQTIR